MSDGDYTQAHHLPEQRGDKGPVDPQELPRQRRGITPQMHGRYPDYDVLEQQRHWDEVTRRVVLDRVDNVPEIAFFDPAELETATAFCDLVTAQDEDPRIPVVNYVDEKLARGQGDGYQYFDMPDDTETWRLVVRGLDREARKRGADRFALLSSTDQLEVVTRFPHGLANNSDQVGRYVMVQGATQVAARFPIELRMYKAPPPEVSSEQFYETDESRGFARGFSIQTISPLPIGWAEHVQAEGHWGHALREYMRDYNHWTVLGLMCELLPQPENRVTLARETDRYGMPVANFTHSLCENDKANIAFATKVVEQIWEAADAQDTLAIDRYAHLVGGCRMGFSPEDSVVDSTQRAWEVPNLYVVDGSVFPTEGAANPALIIMALADRVADLLKAKRA